jgi:hypothetical protein
MSLEWKPHYLDGLLPGFGRPSYIECEGRECSITIEPRPSYCDRGNFIAKIDVSGELALGFDHADLWPRYYFDLERAKLECEAWLKKRGQLPCASPT